MIYSIWNSSCDSTIRYFVIRIGFDSTRTKKIQNNQDLKCLKYHCLTIFRVFWLFKTDFRD